MMEKLEDRGEQFARSARDQQIQRVAKQLRALFGAASVEVQEARVLVRGRGLIKRWLIEPSLRFLGGGLK